MTFKAYLISDCHYDINNQYSLTSLKKTIKEIQVRDDFDAIFIAGDICNSPKHEHYVAFEQEFNGVSSKPIYAIAGNHDDLEQMKRSFSHISTDNKVETAENVDFILMDSSKKPYETMPLGAGRVSQRDIKALSQISKTSIILVHHPIFAVGNDTFQTLGIENRSQLVDEVLNNEHIRYILCGHGHYFIQINRGHVTQYMSPSSCYGFDHSMDKLEKTSLKGFLSIEIQNDELTVEKIDL
ncbi:metallophosphoesterase family protein [Vibrio sagamiensis]|uniref:Calcineurin-like phosphoesterase domain-containing protein n=1 Tax=Vibrio sagamiensis NBRC 104589 TaxID=1219064 RepID=A0A511QDB0_9VIBR|nr:metallophosphoesterase [Vibrio sagamiensis]PNQ58545.1 hypothetical protein C1141_12980 [Vibrio agarivorans]GEM75269.1 hypothetical protein VSA01S_13810 [Vibrio sagamiensis NBRC 104589]